MTIHDLARAGALPGDRWTTHGTAALIPLQSFGFLPQAELDKFLGPSSPARMIFGELSQLVRLSKDQISRGPYAAIARIRVPARNGQPPYLGTMILIKPRLSGLERADLLDYNRINQAFPSRL